MVTETQGTSFEAGSDFAKPADILADLVSGSGAAPQTAGDEPASAPEDSSEESSWQDQAAEAAPAPKPASPVAPVLEVKGGKGVKKFDLDPNNAELVSTLKMGLGFRPMQVERDKAVNEVKALKAQVAPLTEKAQVWDELQSLAQAGHTDRVVRAVLGDQAYAAYRKQVTDEENGYASADPSERGRIDEARARRDLEYARSQDTKKLTKLEQQLQEQADRVESDRLRGIGQAALAKFSFADVVADPDQAEALNQELWSSAWTKLEALADEGQEINEQLVRRVFAQKAKVLKGGYTAIAERKTHQTQATQKAGAQQAAKAAATANYPAVTAQPQAQGWSGKSMTELLRSLRS